MPQLDFSTYPGQIFWLLVTFALLLGLMQSVVTPQLTKIFEKRAQDIKALLDKAESVQKETQNLIQQDHEKLCAARLAVQEKIQHVLEQTRREKERYRQEMDAYFQQKLEEADKNLSLLKEKALFEADFLKNDLTQTLSQKITERGPPHA